MISLNRTDTGTDRQTGQRRGMIIVEDSSFLEKEDQREALRKIQSLVSIISME